MGYQYAFVLYIRYAALLWPVESQSKLDLHFLKAAAGLVRQWIYTDKVRLRFRLWFCVNEMLLSGSLFSPTFLSADIKICTVIIYCTSQLHVKAHYCCNLHNIDIIFKQVKVLFPQRLRPFRTDFKKKNLFNAYLFVDINY